MTQNTEFTLAIWSVALSLVAAAAWYVRSNIVRDRKQRERVARVEAGGRHIPPSLHPVIDPEICIASAACVAACPEGDVIGIVGGAGRLILGAACVGHGRCASECPVDAIRLVFGTAERGVDIPHITGNFETNVPGVYIAGELGGMGLIRNAIRQGVGAARHAVKSLHKDQGKSQYDVLIVGAGPAGIGAALACEEAGVRYVIIEQTKLGGAAANYPRQKIVMSEPIDVPLFGTIHRQEMTKDELLAIWNRIVDETRLVLQTGVRFMGLEGTDGGFTVKTSTVSYTTRKVVVAIGRRGTPRKMGCPGEEGSNVTYELTEPHQYKDDTVAVMGGGDSALEAACTLVEEANANVHLVHRSEAFRANDRNVARLESMKAMGRITVHLNATVAKVDKESITISTKGAPDKVLPAKWAIVLIGGELPTPLLNSIGIRFDKWFGKAPEGSPAADTKVSTQTVGFLDKWLGNFLFVGGMAGLLYLGWMGKAYYGLDADARTSSPDHMSLRPSGLWGHGIGVVATLVMLTNFFYAARKRIKLLRRAGQLRTWLNVHAVVGLLTPAYIAFHAAFTANNFYAILSYYAVGAVVSTGVVGRYVYGRLHSPEGQSQGVGKFKRFMRAWRIIHVIMALLMVVAIVIHIGLSILFGYRWIFS